MASFIKNNGFNIAIIGGGAFAVFYLWNMFGGQMVGDIMQTLQDLPGTISSAVEDFGQYTAFGLGSSVTGMLGITNRDSTPWAPLQPAVRPSIKIPSIW